MNVSVVTARLEILAFSPHIRGEKIANNVTRRRRNWIRFLSIPNRFFCRLLLSRNKTMSTDKRMSRRDWFRLKTPAANRMLGQQTRSTTNNQELQPIELPPNHDGMDLSELPPMREALLSCDQIGVLFGDIASQASDIQLMQRRARSATPAKDGRDQLELAHNAILDGSVGKIQIRYRWQDSLWIDTLERKDDVFRLVRIVHVAS